MKIALRRPRRVSGRVLTLGMVGAGASAAIIASVPANALVQPAMHIKITNYSSYHLVCATGTASTQLYAAGQWVFAIHGSRSNGSAINQLASVPGRTISQCMTVYKQGATQGEYQASLTFAGAGSDVSGEAVGYGAWAPALADITVNSL